jgi:hypothetical protein
MEPFRPLVDQVVYHLVKDEKLHDSALSPEDKEELICPLLGRFKIGDELRTLFDCASKLAISLVQFLLKEAKALEIPFALTFFQEEKPF